NIQVGTSRSSRNREQLIPDFSLEIRPVKIEREDVIQLVAGNSLPDEIERPLERGIVPLDFGVRESHPQVFLGVLIRLAQACSANTPVRGRDHDAPEGT